MDDRLVIYRAALNYAALGFSVIPVNGKKPVLDMWGKYQFQRADARMIFSWRVADILRGFGVVCGRISNCVVIDLDGDEAVTTWRAAFPHLLDTYTVTSGSGHGQHLYYRPTVMPPTTRIRGYELRSDGCYVVAPPSPHPSGKTYAVFHRVPIMQPHNLIDVLAWLRARAWQQSDDDGDNEYTDENDGYNEPPPFIDNTTDIISGRTVQEDIPF
jgi:hypothetical protein